MTDEVKIGVLFKIKKHNSKIYFMLVDILVGYEDEYGFFNAKGKSFPVISKNNVNNLDYGINYSNVKYFASESKYIEINDIITKVMDVYLGNYYRYDENSKDNKILFEKIESSLENKLCTRLFFETKDENSFSSESSKSNKEIYDELINTIIGQDEVVRGVFSHVLANKKLVDSDLSNSEIRKIKSNIFINGPTASGKTFLVEEIASKLNMPVVTVDANDYTAAGFVGDNVNNILIKLYEHCNCDIEAAQKGIIIIDEIDKIASNDSRDKVSTTAVQSALLTLMEGKVVAPGKDFLPVPFDTSKLTFIVMGACSGIEKIAKKREKPKTIGFNNSIEKEVKEEFVYQMEDYQKYGFMPEFIGRFAAIYQTKELTINDFKKIILESLKSPYLLQKKKFELLGYDFELSDEKLNEIAERAKNLKCGARGIKRVINEISEELLFDVVVCEDTNSDSEAKQKTMTMY